ncbi:phenylacrylic acid decarboxylase [Exophiala bonariae]|uniref:Flavin prenyltransferase PAD1, mitochondrial n=1 Tax=Exophiala bonariae TaxID=1690606 RepID=A0AAV9NKQ7_9EURO|nr:phenylacrylic acid decarboxylase [Exophiala bonariae]
MSQRLSRLFNQTFNGFARSGCGQGRLSWSKTCGLRNTFIASQKRSVATSRSCWQQCPNTTIPLPRRKKRVVVAVTGATGSPLAVALLQRLRRLNVETHLILSTWAVATLKYELDAPDDRSSYFASLADYSYSPRDVSASLSSGSFRTDGMIIVPCSMKTLASIRIGYDTDLITRAASVTLKERRRLILVARETPLSSIHLENMLRVSEAGAVVMPPVMAFYTRPQCIDDMVQQSVKRMSDLLGVGEDFDEEEEQSRSDVWTGFDWETKKAGEISQRGETQIEGEVQKASNGA